MDGGSGLRGLADRVEALGGRLRVESAAGARHDGARGDPRALTQAGTVWRSSRRPAAASPPLRPAARDGRAGPVRRRAWRRRARRGRARGGLPNAAASASSTRRAVDLGHRVGHRARRARIPLEPERRVHVDEHRAHRLRIAHDDGRREEEAAADDPLRRAHELRPPARIRRCGRRGRTRPAPPPRARRRRASAARRPSPRPDRRSAPARPSPGRGRRRPARARRRRRGRRRRDRPAPAAPARSRGRARPPAAAAKPGRSASSRPNATVGPDRWSRSVEGASPRLTRCSSAWAAATSSAPDRSPASRTRVRSLKRRRRPR